MERTIRVAVIAAAALLIYSVVHAVTQAKFDKLADILPRTESAVTAAERERQLDCLAINIYREAGYEPFEGKVAVAQVTMNRVEHPEFPKDVCAVVYEKNNWSGRIVCQFSWYCDSTHRNRPIGKGYEESYEVAKRVLLEGFRLPSLEDALFYHADYVNPRWRLDRIQQIGTHIFYRPRVKANDA
jgi:spore germination cell wall hydrolase CwlJ-like protein